MPMDAVSEIKLIILLYLNHVNRISIGADIDNKLAMTVCRERQTNNYKCYTGCSGIISFVYFKTPCFIHRNSGYDFLVYQ